MSSSGLCRPSSRAHEVGPVPVFVSEENPRASARGERGNRLICLHSHASLWRGLPVPFPLPHHPQGQTPASLDGFDLSTAFFLTRGTHRKVFVSHSWDGCRSHGGQIGEFRQEADFVGHHCGWKETWVGGGGGGEGSVSSALVCAPDDDTDNLQVAD